MSSRTNHELLTIVRSVRELQEAASTRYYRYYFGDPLQPANEYYLANLTAQYDGEFFAGKALVLFLFNATSAGGSVDITGLQRQGSKLTIDADIRLGTAAAMSYWSVIIKVAQSDVSGVEAVNVK